jgi:hypothetical protein
MAIRAYQYQMIPVKHGQVVNVGPKKLDLFSSSILVQNAALRDTDL